MTKPKRTRAIGLAVALLTLGALAVVIGQVAPSRNASAAAPPSLKKVCGNKIVVQTDWFPEPEYAALYQLAGVNGTLDTKKGRYTGTIGKTGVKLEIRAGGPFTGTQQPISQMYQDSSITLGQVNLDEAVNASKTLPTVAIVSPMEFSPQILMWNPEKLHIKSFGDIAKTKAKVLVFEGGVWMDYLVSRGWVERNQVDTSYDGSPTRFVAADGGIVQQGFATSEPYQYQYEIKEYGKPVAYLMIKNSGYVPYPQAIAARPDVIKKKRACFKQLVPLIQKAEVDYITRPGPVNRKLVDIVTHLNTFWRETVAGNAFNAAQQRKLGLVQNGPDCTLGNFSLNRVQKMINLLLPIYRDKGSKTFKEDLRATDIVTNEFIDPKIGLPKEGCPKH